MKLLLEDSCSYSAFLYSLVWFTHTLKYSLTITQLEQQLGGQPKVEGGTDASVAFRLRKPPSYVFHQVHESCSLCLCIAATSLLGMSRTAS